MTTESVTAYLNLSATGGAFFTLDSATKGVLDGATYKLPDAVSAVPSDLTGLVKSVTIRRGRARILDEVTVGVAQVTCVNYARQLDPSYAAGTYYGNIKPGKRVTFQTNGITTFDGLIDDWNFNYDVSGDSVATFDVADCLATLGATEFDDWTATAAQTPGARITSALNRSEVNFAGGRNIGTGSSTLTGDNVSWGSNVLNYLQLVTKSDLGRLFAAKDGTLTFIGRNGLTTTTGALKFADDGTGIPFTGVGRQFGTELLFNRVSVDAVGLTKQTAIDATSQSTYGVRTLGLSTLLQNSTTQTLDMATYLVGRYANPTDRFETVTVFLNALTDAQQTAVLNLELGSVIEVVYTPNRLSTAIDLFCVVEGIAHVIVPGNSHTVTLSVSNYTDSAFTNVFRLDDTVNGVLGTGVLAF